MKSLHQWSEAKAKKFEDSQDVSAPIVDNNVANLIVGAALYQIYFFLPLPSLLAV